MNQKKQPKKYAAKYLVAQDSEYTDVENVKNGTSRNHFDSNLSLEKNHPNHQNNASEPTIESYKPGEQIKDGFAIGCIIISPFLAAILIYSLMT